MKRGEHDISELTPTQRRRAVETLISAFAEDPVTAHLFPDPAKRARGMAHVFQMGLRYGQTYGRVDGARAGGAVAVWIRPEYTAPSWIRMVRVGMLTSPFAMGWGASQRMLRFEHFIAGCRWRAVGVPHWFLLCLGVHPDHQGQGLGADLIRHGLQRNQVNRAPCYLETANEHNLGFYRKHGFRVIGQKQVPATGPGIWSLMAGCDNNQIPSVA